MKLVAIYLANPIRNLRPPLDYIEIGKTRVYDMWEVYVRGPVVLLVSPPGWRAGQAASGDKRDVYEIPRSECTLRYQAGPDDVFEDREAGVAVSSGAAMGKGAKPSKVPGLDATKAPE